MVLPVVRNLTDNVKLEFQFVESVADADSMISVGDELTLIADRRGRNVTSTWKLGFGLTTGLTPVLPETGDKLTVRTQKPFSSDDVFVFSTTGWQEPAEEDMENVLDNIYVVPDPYVAVNSLERRQSAALSGRGERRIDFVNLPIRCTIRIFTMSGQLVTVIEHNGFQDNGRESWDLTTDDGLEIAYGIYIFHVQAPGIGEKLGRFAVIK